MKEGVPVTISKKSMKWIPWLLVLPVVIIRGFTTLYPILMTVRNSFFDIKILSGINEFCGIQNYLKIFSDPKVLTSIRFTVIFVVVSMIFHVILGVGLALILNMKFKGRRFLRTIVLIPWAMPAVVVGMAAKWAFNNDYGLINDFIRLFVHGYQNSWLINTGSARAAVIAVDLWKDLPFFAILVLSGLQFISGDIYEAAKVDGANGIQCFFRITLPLILKNVLTLSIPFTLWRLTDQRQFTSEQMSVRLGIHQCCQMTESCFFLSCKCTSQRGTDTFVNFFIQVINACCKFFTFFLIVLHNDPPSL